MIRVLLLTCITIAASSAQASIIIEAWDLTRNSDLVAVGKCKADGKVLTFAPERILKGTAESPITFELSLKDVTPPPNRTHPFYSIVGSPELIKGERAVVFLNKLIDGTTSHRIVASSVNAESMIRQIKDYLAFASLKSSKLRCEFLVRNIVSQSPSSFFAAELLLEQFATVEFLPILDQLKTVDTINEYCRVLAEVKDKQSTQRLLKLLDSKDPNYVMNAVAALTQHDDSGSMFRQYAKLVTHPSRDVRSMVIQVLGRVDFDAATADVFKALDDKEPTVREVAAAWPWYGKLKKYPTVIEKLRKLTKDPNSNVRLAAAEALVQCDDVDSFASLYMMSMTAESQYARSSIHLDLLIERHPFRIGALLLLPTVMVAGFVFWRRKQDSPKSTIRLIGIGIFAGYVVGAVLGFLIGEYYSDNSLIHGLFLTPAIVCPLSTLAISFRLRRAENVQLSTATQTS